MGKTKIAVERSDLERQLLDQLGFLRRSIRDYDAGELAEFKRMATTIRLLVNDTRNSHSLMGQLSLKNDFLAYSWPSNPTNLLSEFNVGGFSLSADGAIYFPNLRSVKPRVLDFANWWHESIIKNQDGNHISRRDVVLAVADKDGGAHVDSHLDGVYHALSKLNSLGWTAEASGVRSTMAHAEKVAIRHIAFEVVDNIERGFLHELGRRGCWCGSGRSARYCHLKEVIASNGAAGTIAGFPESFFSPHNGQ